MTATRSDDVRSPQQRRDDRAAEARAAEDVGPGSWVLAGAVFVAIGVAVVTLLLSQFGTIRDAASPLDPVDERLVTDAAQPLPAPWDDVRGTWATGPDGASVATPGSQVSMAVRPVHGIDGSVTVTGPLDTDGWAVVARWVDAGSYALAIVEPSEQTVSLVAVVSDRTRLLGTGALPATHGDGVDEVSDREVTVEADGPILEVRVDGILVTAGREDDLQGGTHAGIAVVGDGAEVGSAAFTRFRTAPPDAAGTRTLAPGGGS